MYYQKLNLGMQLKRFKYSYVIPIIQFMYTVKVFQVLLCNTIKSVFSAWNTLTLYPIEGRSGEYEVFIHCSQVNSNFKAYQPL